MHKFSTRTVISLAAIVLFGLMAASVAAADVHWTYSEHGGAAAWGELKDEAGKTAFPDCNLSSQSPIDIAKSAVANSGSALAFSYTPTDLIVTNNGHTIQVNYSTGSTVKINGKEYKLLQFHFHTPSEHTLDGAQTVMELHLVHQAADGELAVIGLMMVPGAANPTLQKILDKMPAAEGSSAAAGTINAADFLPANKGYYAYNGSLTTPPCSEGVKWHVLSSSVEVSAAQVTQFRALGIFSDEHGFVGNARPVQKLNGRTLLTQQASPTASPSASPAPSSPTAAPSASATVPPTAVLPPAPTPTQAPTLAPTQAPPPAATPTRVAPAPPATGEGPANGADSPAHPLELTFVGLAFMVAAAAGIRARSHRG